MATYIDTALVSSAGKLLIQLDDGTVIDAGYVKGSQGPAGRDGQDGAPGIPGAKGDPGENGAKWHTGVGAPEIGLGDAGDLYMDVANALLPIYQKVGRDWIFLANLKVPPSGGGGGQGGAAGGGGSVIIYPPPNPGDKPSADNNGNPLDKGDLWFDPTTGLIWIYDGNNWVPIGDRPPVSISPDPPLWNPAGDTNNRYPIVEGDLWFDSDQLALYVAAEDELGDLRWVITTPADRSVLQDEIDIPDLPFRFPSPKAGGGDPFDGMTVYNPVTKLWYVFNANKNQWIDLPPGVNELSLQAILVRGADDFDENFEFNQADRDRLQTNALCYVNADDHDDFTRIVIPDFDTAGFDWSFILRGLQAGDQLTLIQKDETDPDDIFPFRSDYLTVGEIVENSESFNTEISFESEQPLHVPLFDEPVLIRFKAIVNTGEDEIYYQENAPDPITNPELTAGNIWIDSDDNKLYVWNGTSWSEVTACTGTEVGDYVLKAGDTMSGALTMDNADHIHMVNTDLDFQARMDDNGSGTWDPAVDRFMDIESMVPQIIGADGSKSADYSDNFGINFKINAGNTGKNRLKVSNRYGDIVTFKGGTGPQIVFADYEDPSQGGFRPNTNETGLTEGIPIRGIPTPDFDNSPSDIAVNKEYVDARDELIQREVEVLQEEIEAITPTTDKGIWQDGASATPGAGHFAMRLEGGAITQNYEDTTINSIIISTTAKDGSAHSFLIEEVGDLIQLFDIEDKNYGLFEIEAIDTASSTEYVFFTVKWLQGLGETHVDDDVLIKTFAPPTGGTASEFLPLVGGVMLGEVEWNKTDSAAFSGIKLITSASDPNVPDDRNGRVFYANMGASYSAPQVTCGVPPTQPQSVVNKKYVDNLFDFSQYTELS